MIDLDEYTEPKRDNATLALRREALIEQLGWLESEAGALAPLLADLPSWAIDKAPLPTDLSVKQTFSALTALDRDVHPVWLSRVITEECPTLATPDPLVAQEGANERPLDELLGDLGAARAAFREKLGEVPSADWTRALTLDGQATDVYGLALTIVRRDADHLKELAYRLHSADVTMRPTDAS